MSAIHEDLPYQSFTMPSGITTATVCSRSGKLPIAGLCDATLMTEYFETGTEPTTTCDVHYSGWVCLIDGLPATEECPFKYSGILELIPVEADVLASGSTILNPDGTVTTPSMTNMCQHTPEFYALPEASILIQQQWDSLTPEYKQALVDFGGSDYFRNLYAGTIFLPLPSIDPVTGLPITPPDQSQDIALPPSTE